MLEYYGYRIVHEYCEGMGGAVITRTEFPGIYDELVEVGMKLDRAMSE